MQWLKQSTAVTLKIGPFLDDGDGKTAETGLTVTQAEVRLSKNGGNIAQKNEGTNCTHDELGIYGCPIDTTDTDTLGRLQLWVHESGALPVWHEYMVVPANVWGSLFGSEYLDVDTVTIEGADATDQLAAAVGSAAAVDAIWDEVMETNAPANAQTARQWMRLIMSALAGVAAGVGDWSSKSVDGSKTRISGTLDATGARSSVDILDGS